MSILTPDARPEVPGPGASNQEIGRYIVRTEIHMERAEGQITDLAGLVRCLAGHESCVR
ncbi:MAG: hypothetical protein AAFR47_17465 [Pseudomonadota bacterium]